MIGVDIPEELSSFIFKVNSEQLVGSFNLSVATVELLKNYVMQSNWNSAQDLIDLITRNGKILITALPRHSSVGNSVRRILKIIREEYSTLHRSKQEESDQQESLHKIVKSEGGVDDYTTIVPELKNAILDHISEFQMELETSGDNVAQQAREHIHANEIILTLGHSRSVEAFLKRAALDRKFEVIIAEGAPSNQGHSLAASLAKNKIQTTVVSDATIFGIMSRVNKVILGTHTIMANGGLRAISGSHAVALAAKHYSVPVIVLAPMYKLSPHFLCSYDRDFFNTFASPEGVLSYSEASIFKGVHIYNPVFDYVPPELITLLISNIGGHAPSYFYRLLSELYHADDSDL
ncbi:unnamed protein product [Bemisia tabaci]|uniref:Translation initiation factor eIF2B subunit beta n=1 Tax=Bemisia tabaci TaxID=7038 RepID=A0A9P0A8T3_BEMTA|nr:PREDICTED: translation initiation factor eIF-2B subunit beta [Bemisia tabaci]CAH0386647.1 unnamed protein product [Bemisia tabaci]